MLSEQKMIGLLWNGRIHHIEKLFKNTSLKNMKEVLHVFRHAEFGLGIGTGDFPTLTSYNSNCEASITQLNIL